MVSADLTSQDPDVGVTMCAMARENNALSVSTSLATEPTFATVSVTPPRNSMMKYTIPSPPNPPWMTP